MKQRLAGGIKMTAIIKVESGKVESGKKNYLIENVTSVNYVDGKLILIDEFANEYKYDNKVKIILA